jgi:hypothetical protein
VYRAQMTAGFSTELASLSPTFPQKSAQISTGIGGKRSLLQRRIHSEATDFELRPRVRVRRRGASRAAQRNRIGLKIFWKK